MKNSFGGSVQVTLFGESHGAYVGATVDGLAPGIPVDPDRVRRKLSQRAPAGRISTARNERDEARFVSGVFEGKTTGAPLTVLIPNEDTRSGDYSAMRALARPGHADYAGFVKYGGCEDYRGGGHFSGRLTAPLVAVGAVAGGALENRGIRIGTHIRACAGIPDRDFGDLESDIAALDLLPFAALDESAGARMRKAIEEAAEAGDSVGGVLETAVLGVPAGVGEPWFDGIESALSRVLFGIPAVKGVEFGDGFALAAMRGSEANDPFTVKDGAIVTETNRNGGVNGGITNGMPLLFRTAIKPTPSIALPQRTVDFVRMRNAETRVGGRHDPAIVHRARAAVDAVTALALADLLALRFGTDWLGGA